MMRAPRIRRVVVARALAVLAVLGLGTGAIGTVAYCQVFGCSLFPEPFDPEGGRAQAQRTATRDELDRVLDAVTGRSTVLGEAWEDRCVEGRNSWKRKDPHAHECTLAVSRIVVVTTEPADVGKGLTEADAAARRQQCRPLWPEAGLAGVRREHWEPLAMGGGGKGATTLPGARYVCRASVLLELRPTASDEDPDALTGARIGAARAGEPFAPADLARLRGSAAELALLVTAEEPYYVTSF